MNEKCEYCVGFGTFGLARVDDPRYFGGLVSPTTGLRHDPCLHYAWCWTQRQSKDWEERVSRRLDVTPSQELR